MTKIKRLLSVGLGLAMALAFLLLAMLLTGSRSQVDWHSVRAVVIESDDWGLAGFTPAADSWQGLDRDALETGKFPPVYWNSTLEDSLVVADLVAMLAKHRGRDGVSAVFQANYVMSSLHWEVETQKWVAFNLPHWPPQYTRPGMWQAVNKGRQMGVWRAEYHGTYHYDPAVRQERGLASDLARDVTSRGIMLFPDSEGAREWSPERDQEVMVDEWRASLSLFEDVFGREPSSVIAADYTWHGWVETLWVDDGVRVIQAKREQRNPLWWPGKLGRVQKIVDRQWTRLWHPNRFYIERNCRLEPVQSKDAKTVGESCLAETFAAWQRGEVAVVESHRVNYAHTEVRVRKLGFSTLTDYLDAVSAAVPGPVFLCDDEVAQLSRLGTSWRHFGDRLILRNLTHGTRIIAVPAAASSGAKLLIFRLAGGEVRDLVFPNGR